MKAQFHYLRIGSDFLEDAEAYPTKRSAVSAYRRVAKELARYDQPIEASIHVAPNKNEAAEYPDYVLSLGPRGGVRCERC